MNGMLLLLLHVFDHKRTQTQGWGTWKSLKALSLKNSISEVSLYSLDVIGLDYFISVYYKRILCVVLLVF